VEHSRKLIRRLLDVLNMLDMLDMLENLANQALPIGVT
jgi:hypothetical protein